MNYDSTKDTVLHIEEVRKNIGEFIIELTKRAINHDKSKLEDPEKQEFDRLTPILKTLKYGSPEYSESLKELKKALDHHYSVNSHHPEHYKNGIDDMDLLDIIEMLCDWKAAVLRNKDGNIFESLDINKVRFKMSDQLYNILLNTLKRMK